MISLFVWGINSLADALQAAASAVAIIGGILIVYNIYSFRLSQNQFRHGVMTHCLDKYWKIVFESQELREKDLKAWCQQYCELVNEELFYFQVGYIPTEVMVEWLDGILYYFTPNDNSEVKNAEEILAEKIQDLSKGYPRIKRAFDISKNDISEFQKHCEGSPYVKDRKGRIIAIIKNLRGEVSRKDRKNIERSNVVFDI